MATVSHLPHVLANVLVAEAAAALSEESERLPEVGPSFRDTTRVAGANPAIWGDIFATNREAVAARGRRRRRAPAGRGRADPRPATRDAVARLARAAREDRRRLLEAELGGRRPARAPGLGREPARTVAEIALALAAPASTSRTWRSTPRPTCAPARSRSGSPARTEAERAAEIVRGLGYSVVGLAQ